VAVSSPPPPPATLPCSGAGGAAVPRAVGGAVAGVATSAVPPNRNLFLLSRSTLARHHVTVTDGAGGRKWRAWGPGPEAMKLAGCHVSTGPCCTSHAWEWGLPDDAVVSCVPEATRQACRDAAAALVVKIAGDAARLTTSYVGFFAEVAVTEVLARGNGDRVGDLRSRMAAQLRAELAHHRAVGSAAATAAAAETRPAVPSQSGSDVVWKWPAHLHGSAGLDALDAECMLSILAGDGTSTSGAGAPLTPPPPQQHVVLATVSVPLTAAGEVLSSGAEGLRSALRTLTVHHTTADAARLHRDAPWIPFEAPVNGTLFMAALQHAAEVEGEPEVTAVGGLLPAWEELVGTALLARACTAALGNPAASLVWDDAASTPPATYQETRWLRAVLEVEGSTYEQPWVVVHTRTAPLHLHRLPPAVDAEELGAVPFPDAQVPRHRALIADDRCGGVRWSCHAHVAREGEGQHLHLEAQLELQPVAAGMGDVWLPAAAVAPPTMLDVVATAAGPSLACAQPSVVASGRLVVCNQAASGAAKWRLTIAEATGP